MLLNPEPELDCPKESQERIEDQFLQASAKTGGISCLCQGLGLMNKEEPTSFYLGCFRFLCHSKKSGWINVTS